MINFIEIWTYRDRIKNPQITKIQTQKLNTYQSIYFSMKLRSE